MALVTDIPTRDSLDGAAQLARLRVAIKDDTSPFRFTDEILSDLLVADDRVVVWRNIVGAPSTVSQFSYTLETFTTPVNRIRFQIGDTDEETLKYTDLELLDLLDVMPLRYVVVVLIASDSTGSTNPPDQWNPITLMRRYLDDTSGATYTDKQLADRLITTNLDPFYYISNTVSQGTDQGTVSSSSSSGSSFASIDGIAFASDVEATTTSGITQASILDQLCLSPYSPRPDYSVLIDGVEQVVTDWEIRWNAL
tara:strand:- start:998 stop:1756 length:759 start_codon:yes stop_codon:yes gene_type:complete